MKVLILTSSLYGTASHHLKYLVNHQDIEIRMVIFNEGVVSNKRKQISNKINKIFKIGVFGALNGIRMRKWFKKDMEQYVTIDNLEQMCLSFNIPFFKTKTINCEITQNLFKEAKADIGLSLGNGYISKKIFSMPRLGMLNVHHEILPQYQNAQSIIWQLYNGSSDTGYTIHKIDQKIDTGEILYQEKVPVQFRDTLSDSIAFTSVLLLKSSAAGLLKVLQNFEFYFKGAKPQGQGNSYTTPTFGQYLKILGQFKKLKSNNLNGLIDSSK